MYFIHATFLAHLIGRQCIPLKYNTFLTSPSFSFLRLALPTTFLFSKTSNTTLGPARFPIWCVQLFCFRGGKRLSA